MANTYHQGNIIRVTGTWTDVDGDPLDPTVVRFEMQNPAGTVTSYVYGTDIQLVKASAGVYYVDIDASISGIWYYRFYSTGVGQAGRRSNFLVLETEIPT